MTQFFMMYLFRQGTENCVIFIMTSNSLGLLAIIWTFPDAFVYQIHVYLYRVAPAIFQKPSWQYAMFHHGITQQVDNLGL